ncbi:uncharacterized protein ACIBXB_003835 [Morphnus guianensis]
MPRLSEISILKNCAQVVLGRCREPCWRHQAWERRQLQSSPFVPAKRSSQPCLPAGARERLRALCGRCSGAVSLSRSPGSSRAAPSQNSPGRQHPGGQNGRQPARSRCGARCRRRPFGASCGDIGRCRPVALLGGLLSGPARLPPSSAAFPAQGAPGRRGGRGGGCPAALRSCLRRGPGRAARRPRGVPGLRAANRRRAPAGHGSPPRGGSGAAPRPVAADGPGEGRAPGRSPRRGRGAAPGGKARAPAARRGLAAEQRAPSRRGAWGGKLALARGSAGSRRGAAGSSPGRGGFSAVDAAQGGGTAARRDPGARGGGRPPAEGASFSPGEVGAELREEWQGRSGGDWQRALLAEPQRAGRRRPVACGRGRKRRFLLPVASAPPARPWAGPLAALPAPPGSSEPRENAPAGQTGRGYF